MKILFLINSLQTMSGASKVMKFIAKEMAEKGLDVCILPIFDKYTEEEIPNCNIIHLEIKANIKGIWRIGALKKIRNEIIKEKPDLVCCFVSDVCVMGRISTLGLPVKLISCDRGNPKSDGILWSTISGWAYKNSDACVFQLEEVKNFFENKNIKKSYVIPNPFVKDDSKFVDFSLRKKSIVSSGRFTDQKGYDILIKAYNEVYKKHPDYNLIIYGDGPLRKSYEKQIKELNLEEKIKLPGFIKNVSEVIKDASVFCLSSRYEGIPNSLIEALSLGIPSVATDCEPGGARFLLDNERRGILVPIDDYIALADGINYMIENSEDAKQFATTAIEVRNLFEPTKIAEKWFNIFKTV